MRNQSSGKRPSRRLRARLLCSATVTMNEALDPGICPQSDHHP